MKLTSYLSFGVLLLALGFTACASKNEVVALHPQSGQTDYGPRRVTTQTTGTVSTVRSEPARQTGNAFATPVVNSYDEARAADEATPSR